MAKAEKRMATFHGEDNQCVCLSKSEKRVTLLLCCVRAQTPCPVHSTNRLTESTKADSRVSLLQSLRNVLFALFKKNPEKDQPLSNENFTTDLKELNQDIPRENNDVNETARSDQVYYTEDDLVVAAQSMFSSNRRRHIKQPPKRVSEQVLRKYANYDENRERISF